MAQYQNFTEFYNDDAADIYAGTYTTLMEEFDANINQYQPVPLALRTYTATNTGYSVPFLLVTAPPPYVAADPGMVTMFHHVSVLSPRPGMPATIYDGNP